MVKIWELPLSRIRNLFIIVIVIVIVRNVNVLGGMFPVISLEKEEAVLVNLGQFQFE